MFALALPATPSSVPSASGERSRSVCTSVSVDSAEGPSSGITWNASTLRSSLAAMGATASTDSCAASCSAISSCVLIRSSSSTPSVRSATTSRVPFMPAPKDSSMVV